MFGLALIIDPGFGGAALRGVFTVLSSLGLSVSLSFGLLGDTVSDLCCGGVGVLSRDVGFGIFAFLRQSSSRSLKWESYQLD